MRDFADKIQAGRGLRGKEGTRKGAFLRSPDRCRPLKQRVAPKSLIFQAFSNQKIRQIQSTIALIFQKVSGYYRRAPCVYVVPRGPVSTGRINWPYQLAVSTGRINWPYQLAVSTESGAHLVDARNCPDVDRN